MVYLKRSVRRRFGPDVIVRFVDVKSAEALRNSWSEEKPLPLVIVNGKVFSRGKISFYKINQELYALRKGK